MYNPYMEPCFIQSFVDMGLGNSAYLIGSHETKKGILMNPLRDMDWYLHTAYILGLTLTHALKIHLQFNFIANECYPQKSD